MYPIRRLVFFRGEPRASESRRSGFPRTAGQQCLRRQAGRQDSAGRSACGPDLVTSCVRTYIHTYIRAYRQVKQRLLLNIFYSDLSLQISGCSPRNKRSNLASHVVDEGAGQAGRADSGAAAETPTSNKVAFLFCFFPSYHPTSYNRTIMNSDCE